MKQFIVLSAVLPILMIFTMQAVIDQRTNHEAGFIRDLVYEAKEEAREEGDFTAEIQDRLRRNLCRALSVTASEISIICREEGGLLYYRVEAPIKGVVAGGGMLGIRDEDNQYRYVIDSYTKLKNTALPDGDDEI